MPGESFRRRFGYGSLLLESCDVFRVLNSPKRFIPHSVLYELAVGVRRGVRDGGGGEEGASIAIFVLNVECVCV